MGKMSELDRQMREVKEVMNKIKPNVETDLEYAKRVSMEETMNGDGTEVTITENKEVKGTWIITIPVYYTIDDETGIRHYDTDSMREEFKKKIEQLEDNTQAEVDGWNEKQQDYAMDNEI